MFLSHHQNIGQNHNIMIANKSFENVTEFKYFQVTVTDPNLIHEKFRFVFNSGSACYRSVQNLLSSTFLHKTD